MAIALVQSKGAATNAAVNTITVTPTAATTAGNLLVMFVLRGAGSTDPTFTPPANWVSLGTIQRSDGWNFCSGQAWYYPNNPGGIASVTVTCSANFGASGSAGGAIYLLEFSGVATTSPLDTHNESVAASFTTTPGPISTTTTTDGDLIVGLVFNDVGHAGGTITEPASPWTGLAQAADGAGWVAIGAAYQVQATHGAVSYAPTFSASNDWILWIASFAAAGGGGGGTVAGGGTLAANATLADAANALVAPNAPLPANAALAETAQLVAPAATPLASNAGLSVTGQILANGLALASNAGLSVTGQIVANAASAQANAALGAPAAQLVTNRATAQANASLSATPGAVVVEPSAAPLQANAVLNATGGEVGQNLLVANAGLSVTARVVTPSAPPLAAYSILAEAAQIVATAAALQSNAILSATGTAQAPSQPGLVTASDRATNPVTATTAALTTVGAGNTAATLVTAKDG